MLAEVRKCAENHDIKGLRYIFVDCLDVDPTFEKYKADYEYCKSIDGMFDSHQELTGLTVDEGKWTMQYWERLKLDLMKNFSEKRFEHMVKVAKVVYADKIARLLSERKNLAALPKTASAPTASQTAYQMPVKPLPAVDAPRIMSNAELQEKKVAERTREIEAENQRIEAEQRAQRARIDAAKQTRENSQSSQDGTDSSKKALGIVLAVATIAVIVVVVLIIKTLH